MKKLTKLVFGAAALGGLYVAAQRTESGRMGLMKLMGKRYAHRGLHDMGRGVPENTLPAFEAAFENGYGAELDVRLTRDGKLAVVHDSVLTRLCGSDMKVEASDYDEIRELPILGSHLTIPLFEDVLKACAGAQPLIVEIKTEGGNYADICAKAAELLDGYEGDFCVESFDPRAVKWFRDNRPNVIRGQLAANFVKMGEESGMSPLRRFVMTNMLTNFMTKPDFIAYNYPDRDALPVRITTDLYGAGEFSWTIDKMRDMDVAEATGATVIFERFRPEQ